MHAAASSGSTFRLSVLGMLKHVFCHSFHEHLLDPMHCTAANNSLDALSVVHAASHKCMFCTATYVLTLHTATE